MTALLHLRLWWWRYSLRHARQFRVGLEQTIINERIRAQRDVERCEIMVRRAEMAIVEARADRTIREAAK